MQLGFQTTCRYPGAPSLLSCFVESLTMAQLATLQASPFCAVLWLGDDRVHIPLCTCAGCSLRFCECDYDCWRDDMSDMVAARNIHDVSYGMYLRLQRLNMSCPWAPCLRRSGTQTLRSHASDTAEMLWSLLFLILQLPTHVCSPRSSKSPRLRTEEFLR